MTIAIIGLGYVGLPLSLQFACKGTTVIGIDIDPAKIETLVAGRSYIKHVAEDGIKEAVKSGKFVPTADFARICDCEAVIICVPTPLTKTREPDLSYVLDTGRAIAPHLQPGMLVVLESTTYPGTTEEDLRAVLEQNAPVVRNQKSEAGGQTGGTAAVSSSPSSELRSPISESRRNRMVAGRDFHLAYSPEREDPGNPDSKVAKIPKIVGGYTPACLERAKELYGRAIETLVPVSSCRAAEATRLLENIFRSVNIALVRSSRSSTARWASTCGKLSMPPRQSLSATWPFTQDPAAA